MNLALAERSSSEESCLDDETLGAFLEGRLDFASMARIDSHASQCPPCRELIALGARVAGDSIAVGARGPGGGGSNERRGRGASASMILAPNNRRLGSMLKDKWRLDAVVGVGGMAEVYAGTHRNGKKVAVKILLPQLAVDTELCRRFVQEGYIANHVDHPGVVAVHDNDLTDDGAPFLVMDLLEGECISDTIQRGRLPVPEAVRIAHTLLEILGAAHAKGVLHRDIKPGNIFRTHKNEVKLLDFGIARVDSGGGARTMTGATMGTPAYMPPEQARGVMREVDARSDVWAVGATLFSMLTTAKVREAETNNELLVMAVTQSVRSIRERAPWIAPELASIVDKALSFDKADRFQSAQEMATALAALAPSALRDPGTEATLQLQPETYIAPTVATPPPAWTMMARANSSPPATAAGVPRSTLFNRRKGATTPSTTPLVIAGGAISVFAALIIAAIVAIVPSRHARNTSAATGADQTTAVSSATILTAAEPPKEVTAPATAAAAASDVAPPAAPKKEKKAKSASSAHGGASSSPGDPYDRRL